MPPHQLHASLPSSHDPRPLAPACACALCAAFPGVAAYMEKVIQSAYSSGSVRTLNGRVRPLPGLHAPAATVRKEAERRVVNSIVQGR